MWAQRFFFGTKSFVSNPQTNNERIASIEFSKVDYVVSSIEVEPFSLPPPPPIVPPRRTTRSRTPLEMRRQKRARSRPVRVPRTARFRPRTANMVMVFYCRRAIYPHPRTPRPGTTFRFVPRRTPSPINRMRSPDSVRTTHSRLERTARH